MHRGELLALLARHRAFDADERAALERIVRFVRSEPRCFARDLETGHMTGSAWVTSAGADRVVLVHHRKLERWLQPGGHADGDADLARVAEREAAEETGLRSIALWTPEIYDVDVHAIPARGEEPEHFHYDVRFRFTADPSEAPVASAESRAVRWLSLDEARRIAPESSVLRMIEKLEGTSQTRRATP